MTGSVNRVVFLVLGKKEKPVRCDFEEKNQAEDCDPTLRSVTNEGLFFIDRTRQEIFLVCLQPTEPKNFQKTRDRREEGIFHVQQKPKKVVGEPQVSIKILENFLKVAKEIEEGAEKGPHDLVVMNDKVSAENYGSRQKAHNEVTSKQED